ncbi:hypothetical protein GGI07_001269 [Coemansia sp. Benny D115]|nr:hypothetical protein GGI07_001269 [Coemansia sp. Benny D115]
MDFPGRTQAELSERTWQVSIPLRPGACTVVDWAASVEAEENDPALLDGTEQALDEAEDSDSSNDNDVDGYASGTTALPPGIANDPFFARLLRNAELRDAKDKKKAAKKQQSKRRPKDAAEDNYDLDDPFIDDSELTFMDGHAHTKTQQRKKRRKKDDGNGTESDAQGISGFGAAADCAGKPNGVAKDTDGTREDGNEFDEQSLEDIDKYDEDDFFVYFGPLNEMVEGGADEGVADAPESKKSRARKRPDKKQIEQQTQSQSQQQPHQQQSGSVKDGAQSKRKSNTVNGSKADTTDAVAKKKTDAAKSSQAHPQPKQQTHNQKPTTTEALMSTPVETVSTAGPAHKAAPKSASSKSQLQSSSQNDGASGDAKTAVPGLVAARNVGQIPSNGRKAGPRTSRKLDQQNKTDHGSVGVSGAFSAGASSHDNILASINDRNQDESARGDANSTDGDHLLAGIAAGSTKHTASENANNSEAVSKAPCRRGGTPAALNGMASDVIMLDETKAINEARLPTPEIEAAIAELVRATEGEPFSNRQRFPSSLKPPLRQVCELSMAHALEYDRSILELDTPENYVFSWSTPLDLVGFTTGIYHRLADTLPYNKATVRKIVSKLLGQDLINWKERQLKQLEEGLKMRIDSQIERGLGWIPVAGRSGSKEGDDASLASAASATGASGAGSASSSGAQVRWHWTTISKHILYQYMLLTLNINELRNHFDQGSGKDGSYREQQARKDAYAHLVNLWPNASMSTYDISRAYSSRKLLMEKQTKKTDTGAGQSKGGGGGGGGGGAGAAAVGRGTPDASEGTPAPVASSAAKKSSVDMPIADRQPEYGDYVQDNGGLHSEYPSHKVSSHRNVGFEDHASAPTVDQQVRNRVASFYDADGQGQMEGYQRETTDKRDEYTGSKSSRYSMSVHNLTTP